MGEQTTSEETVADSPPEGVSERARVVRVPPRPLPSFDLEGSSFEIPGIIPSAKAILRALHLR
jgi:hypothetical protein